MNNNYHYYVFIALHILLKKLFKLEEGVAEKPLSIMCSGVSSMELRVLEHPPQLWHNSQLSTSAQILSMIIDNWQLLPTINLLASKIRSLNRVFSLSLGLKQPLSASYLQERVNEGRGQRFGGVAKNFASRTIDLAPPSFKPWIRH